MKVKTFCLGFLFSDDRNWVVMTKKNRPDWQAGKMNGLGGAVKIGELPEEAMIREFQEESGIYFESWKMFAEIFSPGSRVIVYCGFAPFSLVRSVKTQTDEPVCVLHISHVLKYSTNVPTVNWLIAMALDEVKDATIVI